MRTLRTNVVTSDIAVIAATDQIMRLIYPHVMQAVSCILFGAEVADIISVGEACKRYCINPRTLSKILRRGDITRFTRGLVSESQLVSYVRKNRRMKVNRDVIDAYVKARPAKSSDSDLNTNTGRFEAWMRAMMKDMVREETERLFQAELEYMGLTEEAYRRLGGERK